MSVPDILKPPIFSFEPPGLNEPWPNYLYWHSLAEAFCRINPPMSYHPPLPNIPLRNLVRRAFQTLNRPSSEELGFTDQQKEVLPLVLSLLLAWVEGPLLIDVFRSNEAARNGFLKEMLIVSVGDRKVMILPPNNQVDQSHAMSLYEVSKLGKLPVNSSDKWLFLPITLAQRFNLLPPDFAKVSAIKESFRRRSSKRGFVEPMDLLPLDELALETVAYLLWRVLLGFTEKEKQRIEELIREYSRLPLYPSYPPNLDYSFHSI